MSKKVRSQDIKALVAKELACGDCSGLTREALLPNEPKPCNNQGRSEKSKLCKHFRSDTFSLSESMQGDAGDVIVGLAETFSQLKDKDLRIIAGLLLAESRTRRQGLSFGQPIFVRHSGRAGRDYISNFMACRVLEANEDRIKVISEDGTLTLTYANEGTDLKGPTLYTQKVFKKLHRKMKAEKMLIDPEKEIKRSRIQSPEEEIKFKPVRSLDGFSVPRLEEVATGRKGKTGKKTSTIMDLSRIVNDIESGYDMGSQFDEEGSVILKDDDYILETGKTERRKKKRTKKIGTRNGKLVAFDLGDIE